ncbi:MAG: dTDP-4-dehydrorhamnose reductase [Chloroflexota bacterium]
MIRILLLGKKGQLGWELQRTLAPLGRVVALDFPEIDLRKPDSLRQVIQQYHPELIINATAYTDVDRAESEPQTAIAINAQAPGVLAEMSRALGAALIHYSTDYVFNGRKGSAYLETDTPDPLNTYGQSKLAGEQAIASTGCAYLILRTSWVYSFRRDNFVLKVLNWSRTQQTLRIVDDQISNPTWARMLAETSAQLLATLKENMAGRVRERTGIYHVAGNGWASRLEWAKAILQYDPRRHEQIVREILPARTAEFPTPAKRPLFSALDCNRFSETFQLALPAWQESLQLASVEQGKSQEQT